MTVNNVRTITRVRNDLSWSFTNARYCQAICEANKTKRLDWCSDRIKEKEMFDNVIFTDESTIQLQYHRRISFRKKTPRKLKYRHKHPLKIQGEGRNIDTGSHTACDLLWDHEHHQIRRHSLCLPFAFHSRRVPWWPIFCMYT